MSINNASGIIPSGLQLTVILTSFFIASAPVLAELPEAIVNSPEELQKVEQQPSGQTSDDLSRELSNPNTPLAKLTLENTTTFYDGDLPNSDDQWSNLTLFQPIFPFPLVDDGTTNLFVRPAFTFLTGRPSYDSSEGIFYDETGLGDMGFDVALGQTYTSGWIIVGGIQGTIPTGTRTELTGGQFRLGPELAVVYMNKKGFIGAFPQHQWDVSGWKDNAYSTTNIELWGGVFLEDGWTLITNPVLSYDWEGEQWTIPLNLTAKKVVQLGSVPLQISGSFDYFVEQSDEFGPEWAFTLSFTPIVPNFIYSWLTKP